MKKESILAALARECGGKCFYCRRELIVMDRASRNYSLQEFRDLRVSRDHFVPRSWGRTNEAANLVASCCACNLQRGSSLPSEAEMRRFVMLKGKKGLRQLVLLSGRLVAEIEWRRVRHDRR